MSFKDYRRSIKLEFDYNQVKEGVPNVSRQMAILNAEFRKSSAEAQASGNEIDKLGTRYDYLNNRIKIQEQEVEKYRDRLEKATNAKGNNTKAIQNNTASLEIAEAKLAQTRAELEKTSDAMAYQQGVIDKNSEEWKTLEHQMAINEAQFQKASAEAEISGKTINKLTAEHEKLTSNLKTQEAVVEAYKAKLNEATNAEVKNEDAIRENKLELAKAEAQLAKTKSEIDKVTKELEKQKTIIGKTSEEWKKLGDKTSEIGKSMSMKFTVPILAAAGASFKLGADFEQALGKMDVVFEGSAKNIERWAQNSLRDFGLARLTAIEMASDFGALFKGMGVSLGKTEEWSKTLTERTMDLANFYDTTVEETNNALNAIVTGQTQPLRRFGINMTQATLQEYAFAQGIRKKVADMTEAEKVQLRYNFVIERTNIAVGTTARESDTATGQMNKFKEVVKELGTNFSDHILPIFTPLLAGLNSLLESIAGLSDGTKKFIVVAGGIVAVVGPVLLVLGSVFGAIKNISEGIGKVPKILDGLSKAGRAFSGLLDNTAFLGFAKWALIIAGVALAIAALVVAINYLIGKGKEMNEFSKNMSDMVGGIGSSVQGAGVRGYAVGTAYHPGGWAMIGEEGPELLNLPRGSQVYSHTETKEILGQSTGDTFVFNVHMDEIDDLIKFAKAQKDLRRNTRMGVAMG